VKNSKAIYFLLAILAVALVPKISPAEPISIPVTGFGQIEDNKYTSDLGVSGSGFSFVGSNAGSNGAYCGLNTPCTPFLEGDVTGDWTYQGYAGFADVSMTVVAGPFTIRSSCVADPNSCVNLDPWSAGPFPASFNASITGLLGDPINGTITGTGTIDLTGGYVDNPVVIYFNNVDFSFGGSATLTATPEPGSLVLAGSGMLALLGALGRKARAKRC
jgi:hypothetical protein